MMSLTKKADYGLLLVTELASRGKGKIVSTRELVEDRELPAAFTAQIAKKLVRRGILGSKEGRTGGYYLKKDPEDVKVKEVLEAVDGKLALTDCIENGDCSVKCKQKRFMRYLNSELSKMMESYTLADVLNT